MTPRVEGGLLEPQDSMNNVLGCLGNKGTGVSFLLRNNAQKSDLGRQGDRNLTTW